jgi:Na+-transporting NADH:ubiquinone oxidoreductase subunit A
MDIAFLKNGYHLRLAGKPLDDLVALPRPARLAVVPERMGQSRARPKVRPGDRVGVGSVLFEDKRRPEMPFRSPGGGTVLTVDFGPRRVLKQIVIELDAEESCEDFAPVDPRQLDSLAREELIRRIMEGGLWPLIRELPFRVAARPERKPSAIFMYLDNLDPFHPAPQVYLKGRADQLAFGIRLLERLADAPVNISVSAANAAALNGLGGVVTHPYLGSYPAHDPGVLLYRTKRSAAQNYAWFIGGQEVLLLAELLLAGKYPTEQVVTVAGPAAANPRHVRARIGAPVSLLAGGRGLASGVQCIAGGIFSGQAVAGETFLNLNETALLLLSEARPGDRPFTWALPGRQVPSYSRTFLSSFLPPREHPMDGNRHGSLRACIQCGFCAQVCPVDILPQATYKATLAGEVEESLAHGLLDCVECGLCSFVCPSKIELTETFRAARRRCFDELK